MFGDVISSSTHSFFVLMCGSGYSCGNNNRDEGVVITPLDGWINSDLLPVSPDPESTASHSFSSDAEIIKLEIVL